LYNAKVFLEECVPGVKQNQLRGVIDPAVQGLGRGLQEVKNSVKPTPAVKIPKVKKSQKVSPDQAMKECKKSLAEAEWGIEDVLNYGANFFPKAKPQTASQKAKPQTASQKAKPQTASQKAKPQTASQKAKGRILQGMTKPVPKPKPHAPRPKPAATAAPKLQVQPIQPVKPVKLVKPKSQTLQSKKSVPRKPAPPAPVQPKNGWLSKSGYKSIKKVISHSLGICKKLDVATSPTKTAAQAPKKARILKIDLGANSKVLGMGYRLACKINAEKAGKI
jgi:hypothetical protein